jgi:hypothetical protein
MEMSRLLLVQVLLATMLECEEVSNMPLPLLVQVLLATVLESELSRWMPIL